MLGVWWPRLPEQNCLVPFPQGIPSETYQFIVRKLRPKILIQSPYHYSVSALPPMLFIEAGESGSGSWDQEAGLHTVDSKHRLALSPRKSCDGSCGQMAHVSGFCGCDKVSDKNN